MLYVVPTSACIGGGTCIHSVMSLEASFSQRQVDAWDLYPAEAPTATLRNFTSRSTMLNCARGGASLFVCLLTCL